MAIPSVGGGYQVGDGNFNEVVLNVQAAPQTATITATLTVAQITGGLLVATPATGTPAAYTLPTVGTALTGVDAVLVNTKINSSFDFAVINLGDASSVITVTAAAGTGWTLVGSGAVPIAATGISGSAKFRARKTAAGAWTVYRIS
jgi:hypothetical protein